MKRVLTVSCFVMGLAVAQVASAGPITLTVGPGGSAGDRILGEVVPTLTGSSGGQVLRDVLMVNNLRAMGLGVRTASTGVSPEYYRSTTDFGALTPAVADGAAYAGSADISRTTSTAVINLSQRYMYLVAAWDGRNSGVEVWYLGDVAAGTSLVLPRYVKPVAAGAQSKDLVNGYNPSGGSKYDMTTWTLLNPITPVADPLTTVPDGGTTAALLGLAMVGLGCVRRFKG